MADRDIPTPRRDLTTTDRVTEAGPAPDLSALGRRTVLAGALGGSLALDMRRRGLVQVCSLADISELATDRTPPADILAALQGTGTRLTVAQEGV